MRLYSGTSDQFIQDTIQNQIADKLTLAFFEYYRYKPSINEINSWKNSLRAMTLLFQHGDLHDHGVILEYQLPLTSMRLDCMICGKDYAERENAVIVELKQWDRCHEADGDNEVMTWMNGGQREVLHPSAQVRNYKLYLEGIHPAFYDGVSPVILNACSYLHNYSYTSNDAILSDKFKDILKGCPMFSADDVDKITDYLKEKLGIGQGIDVLKKVEANNFRPSKALMDHVGNTIKGNPDYILLDEQLVVYDKVLSWANKGFHDKKKSVIIIKGGPGTGKSVIAINLMADLLLKGFNTIYATGSRAFTQTLRKIIGPNGYSQFKYFNGFRDAEMNAIDVLICDESHRIRETSADRFTPKSKRTDKKQIEELLYVSKVAVFFIDDKQQVRPNEIGSVDYIKEYAQKHGCELYEHELNIQFRCNGSDGFVNWINNTLGIERTANILWTGEDNFDFKIFDSPQALEKAIEEKAQEGYKARLTAGFCWPWSKPNSDGTLKEDVVIDDFLRPWNARTDAGRLAKGIPKADYWAYDKGGINQVGCIYTAQGFDFDYVGVIFGNDLAYDFDEQTWVGHPENSCDNSVKRSKEKFTDMVKNAYRVLLSRGMKGCYVYFVDNDTKRFIKTRIEH